MILPLIVLGYFITKINFKRGGSYVESPDFIKKKKTTKNRKNDDDRRFQYVATIALKLDEKKDSQRFSNVKSFINNCNWEGLHQKLKIEKV